jgi:hypothetical protein
MQVLYSKAGDIFMRGEGRIGKVCGEFRCVTAAAVSEAPLVRISLQKFEVRRASRDIIDHGGATMYAVLLGTCKEGQSMYMTIGRSHEVQTQALTCA